MDSFVLETTCTKTGKTLFIQYYKGADGVWVRHSAYATRPVEPEPKKKDSKGKGDAKEVNINLTGCRVLPSYACPHCGSKSTMECGAQITSLTINTGGVSVPQGRGPYTKWAGISDISGAARDRFGNAQGSQYDLASDNSFKGYKILVIYLCTEGNFSAPEKALKKKGFDIHVLTGLPPYKELERYLKESTQLWLISDRKVNLNSDHIRAITDFFNTGHGVYIWGDNDPYYADANAVIKHIFNTEMSGNRPGDKVLGIQTRNGTPGIVANHLITTGIQSFYEGITIAEIKLSGGLQPLMYGSENQIVTAYYDQNGKRALIDGGFTRLYHRWDSAGTDRYIVNAAAWLANIERFGYKNG